MIPGVLIVVAGLTCLLYAEARQLPRVRCVAKPITSAGFLLAALHAPAVRMPAGPGWLLLAALAAAAIGDVLLLAGDKASFIGGTAAFSLAHLGYIAWFGVHGVNAFALAGGTILMAVLGHLAWRWLERHLQPPLRVPLRAYTALVSLMAAFAIAYGARVAGGPDPGASLLPAVGGVLFCASDVAVARQRFVKRGFENKAWGLPAYYLAQLLFASAVL